MATYITMVGLFVVMAICLLLGKVLGNHLVQNCKEFPKEAVWFLCHGYKIRN